MFVLCVCVYAIRASDNAGVLLYSGRCGSSGVLVVFFLNRVDKNISNQRDTYELDERRLLLINYTHIIFSIDIGVRSIDLPVGIV